MCGIAGYCLRRGPADKQRVQAMCSRIRHRGPDDEGVYVDGGTGIGMRRLSIIDLASGHQPIGNEDGTVWVVFNGEIYNYQELRSGLLSGGHRFATNSDTETLVHLYEQEGVSGLARLRGMFAYAIWDARERSLLLVRDRFGKKPLYYAATADGLYFGSELKCLVEAGVPLEMDPEAVRLYFLLSYIPEPWSIYQSVRKLPPGSWLRYRQATGSVEIGSYWEFPVPASEPPPDLSEEAAITKLRDLFDESVRIRLMADVPLGAFLSGGIDSGSVVASMALQTTEPVKTFSIGFAEAGFNELPAARLVAERYRTAHHEILVRPDSIRLLQSLAGYFDEPFGDSSAIPTFLVSQFAAQHVKVALTGDGGDEIFAGYTRFGSIPQFERLEALPAPLRALISWTSQQLPYSAPGKNYLRMLSRNGAVACYLEGNLIPYHLQSRLLQREWVLSPDDVAEGKLAAFFPQSISDTLARILYFEAKANLVGDMLVKVDRMSMANSLEVRCPLLDHQLAEFAARLPHRWKFSHGRGKRILLKAVGNRLPEKLLTLPKKGFGVPLAHWFRTSARQFLHDHLTTRDFLESGFVVPAFLHHLLDEHQRQRRDNYHWLFRMLMFALWRQEFRRRDSAAPDVPWGDVDVRQVRG